MGDAARRYVAAHGRVTPAIPICGVNIKGERFGVKYHFSDQGIKCMTQEQADQTAGSDADIHRLWTCLILKRRVSHLEDADHALRGWKTYSYILLISPRCGPTPTIRDGG